MQNRKTYLYTRKVLIFLFLTSKNDMVSLDIYMIVTLLFFVDIGVLFCTFLLLLDIEKIVIIK